MTTAERIAKAFHESYERFTGEHDTAVVLRHEDLVDVAQDLLDRDEISPGPKLLGEAA